MTQPAKSGGAPFRVFLRGEHGLSDGLIDFVAKNSNVRPLSPCRRPAGRLLSGDVESYCSADLMVLVKFGELIFDGLFSLATQARRLEAL